MPAYLDSGKDHTSALTRPISAAPASSPQSSPSVPFTVNHPGIAATQFRPRSMESSPQLAPLARIRIKRSLREQSDCAQDSTKRVEWAFLPQNPTQNPRMFNGAGASGISGDVIRAVQHCGGYRDGPPTGKGKGKSKEWDSAKRADAVARSTDSWPIRRNKWSYAPKQ